MIQKITYIFEDEMVNQSTDFTRKYSIKDKTDYTEITDITEYDTPSVGKTNTLNAEIMNDIVDAINDVHTAIDIISTYSETEHSIGTWIDGKTIYRKVYTGTLSPHSSWYYPSNWTLPNNFGKVINMYGSLTEQNGNQKKIPYYESSSHYVHLMTSFTENKLGYECNTTDSSISAIVVLEYTKNI